MAYIFGIEQIGTAGGGAVSDEGDVLKDKTSITILTTLLPKYTF